MERLLFLKANNHNDDASRFLSTRAVAGAVVVTKGDLPQYDASRFLYTSAVAGGAVVVTKWDLPQR